MFGKEKIFATTLFLQASCCLWGAEAYSSKPAEMQKLEEEIQTLQKRLQQENLDEMREEVKGQEFMIADWSRYATEVQALRQKEEKEREIRQQIQALQKQRDALIEASQKKGSP